MTLADLIERLEKATGPDRRVDVIAEVRTYDDFHLALRARAEALCASRQSIDAVAGLPAGYASKLLSPDQIRSVGKESFGPLMGALGVKLLMVEDPESARFVAQLEQRAEWAVRGRASMDAKSHAEYGRAARFEIKQRMTELGRRASKKGGKARASSLTPRQRRMIAVKAVRARWRKRRASKVRITEKKDSPQAAHARGTSPAASPASPAPGRRPQSRLCAALRLSGPFRKRLVGA